MPHAHGVQKMRLNVKVTLRLSLHHDFIDKIISKEVK